MHTTGYNIINHYQLGKMRLREALGLLQTASAGAWEASGLSLARQPPLGASTLHPQGMSRRQAAGHTGLEPAFCAHAAQEHKRVIINQAAQHTGSGSPTQGASPGAQTGLPKPWRTPEAGVPDSPMTIMPLGQRLQGVGVSPQINGVSAKRDLE